MTGDMSDHPDLRNLGEPRFHQVPHPAEADLCKAKAQAYRWLTFAALMAAAPCIAWLWRWAW